MGVDDTAPERTPGLRVVEFVSIPVIPTRLYDWQCGRLHTVATAFKPAAPAQ